MPPSLAAPCTKIQQRKAAAKLVLTHSFNLHTLYYSVQSLLPLRDLHNVHPSKAMIVIGTPNAVMEFIGFV